MRLLAVLLVLLAAAPALAAGAPEQACLYSMAERLPKLPGLRILRADLTSATPGFARTAPVGMRRLSLGGHIVTEFAGTEASYAVSCSVLIDRHGGIAVEADRSSMRLEADAS